MTYKTLVNCFADHVLVEGVKHLILMFWMGSCTIKLISGWKVSLKRHKSPSFLIAPVMEDRADGAIAIYIPAIRVPLAAPLRFLGKF